MTNYSVDNNSSDSIDAATEELTDKSTKQTAIHIAANGESDGVRNLRPLRVFCSYCHQDEIYLKELLKHLALLLRSGRIEVWHDSKIGAGTEWAVDIEKSLELADIVLLLLSADFLASDYCYKVEMGRAMALQRKNQVTVIPIIVRPVSWRDAPFSKLQVLPRNGKPVESWDSSDAAWASIESALRLIIDQMTAVISQQRTSLSQSQYCLRLKNGPSAGQIYSSETGAQITIGRNKDAKIQLPEDDKKASRWHARIEVREQSMVIHDSGSKNGTFVNGKKIQQKILSDQDELLCGESLFRVERTQDPDGTLTSFENPGAARFVS